MGVEVNQILEKLNEFVNKGCEGGEWGNTYSVNHG